MPYKYSKANWKSIKKTEGRIEWKYKIKCHKHKKEENHANPNDSIMFVELVRINALFFTFPLVGALVSLMCMLTWTQQIFCYFSMKTI